MQFEFLGEIFDLVKNAKDENSLFEKFLQDNQRFRNFRRKEDYVSLIEKYFEIQQIHTFDKVYRIPYSKLVFECRVKR